MWGEISLCTALLGLPEFEGPVVRSCHKVLLICEDRNTPHWTDVRGLESVPGETSTHMTLPSWPARLRRGVQPGLAHTLAELSYEEDTRNPPWVAGGAGEEGAYQSASHLHSSELTLELDVRDEVGVGGDRVDTGLFAEVPQPDSIVVASRGHMVAVGAKVHGQHALQVPVQQHDAPPGTQVPHSPT